LKEEHLKTAKGTKRLWDDDRSMITPKEEAYPERQSQRGGGFLTSSCRPKKKKKKPQKTESRKTNSKAEAEKENIERAGGKKNFLHKESGETSGRWNGFKRTREERS